MKAVLLLVLALLLGGCQSLSPEGPDSPYYTIPTGSTLRLVRPLPVPADGVSLYLQDGALVADHSLLRRYHPYCRFEMWSRLPEARQVEPETFLITRVTRNDEYVSGPHRPLRLAGPFFSGERQGGPMAIIVTTTLYLSSSQQPDVYRIGCEQWGDPSSVRPLTIPEMRQALGGIFELALGG